MRQWFVYNSIKKAMLIKSAISEIKIYNIKQEINKNE